MCIASNKVNYDWSLAFFIYLQACETQAYKKYFYATPEIEKSVKVYTYLNIVYVTCPFI